MSFNVKPAQENKERINFNLKESGWDVANVRVVTDHMVTFTLKMHGLSLYNMKVLEGSKGENKGKMFLSNGQSKGSDGKYYNNYGLYLSPEDTQLVIDAVLDAVSDNGK